VDSSRDFGRFWSGCTTGVLLSSGQSQFPMVLAMNSEYFAKQHQAAGRYGDSVSCEVRRQER
jgi:hypothetical protein